MDIIFNTVEFPNLFSTDFRINRAALSIFGIDIYWYGIFITLGVILGFLYAMKRSKTFGMIADKVFDVAFIGTIGGFVGARAYYCIFYNLNPDNLRKYNFITAITEIRDGGLAIYGGIIGSVVVALIYARIKKIHFLPIFDLAGLSFLIGQTIGRWGNFINQEAYGAPTAGNLPWGMTGNIIASNPEVITAQQALPAGEFALVHPCFLYESLWCLLGFLLLHIYSKKLRSFDGEMFLLYVVWYGSGRGFIEGLRMDSLYVGDIRISQLLGFASSVFAVILFVYFKVTLGKNKDYRMLCQNENNIKFINDYKENLELEKEKLAAKKALKMYNKEQENIAPSILSNNYPEDNNDDADNSIDSEKNKTEE